MFQFLLTLFLVYIAGLSVPARGYIISILQMFGAASQCFNFHQMLLSISANFWAPDFRIKLKASLLAPVFLTLQASSRFNFWGIMLLSVVSPPIICGFVYVTALQLADFRTVLFCVFFIFMMNAVYFIIIRMIHFLSKNI